MFSTNILAQEIIGIPKIVDGDTVSINNYHNDDEYSSTRYYTLLCSELCCECSIKNQKFWSASTNVFLVCKKASCLL